jgi:AAA+ ATPase superfamily predicted ATPase
MAQIIGRIEEQNLLTDYLESDKAEFLVIYGRRRVGKTFLIKEFFKNKFAFYMSGAENATKAQQLVNFTNAINKSRKTPYPPVTNWQSAFVQLRHLLENSTTKGRIVVFFDELPWLDSPKSGFLSAFEYFWNTYASANHKIFLVICGSATSWITNKIIKNRGGLHNRVTRQIFLEPFTLRETEEFLVKRNIIFDRHQIAECYMIMGGIPYYLEQMQKKWSMYQNVDSLFFSKKGILRHEFNKLYASLFKNSEKYIEIIEALSSKNKGLTREEIVKIAGISDGGTLTKILEELELCNFIRSYYGFGKQKRNKLYQLIDFYSLFYLNFIKNKPTTDENYWTNIIDNAAHRAWSGYAFEQLCLMHTAQIRRKLGISGVTTYTSSWRSNDKELGAQIDLVIERNDRIINLCEMKYATDEFVITKSINDNLRKKRAAFMEETRTRKTVHITMITTYGVKHNEYWGHIQSEVTLDNLFAD